MKHNTADGMVGKNNELSPLGAMASLMARMGCMDGKTLNEARRAQAQLLTEDLRIDRLKKTIRNYFEKRSMGTFNVDARVTSSDYYVNENPETTWLKYLIFNLRHNLDLMNNKDVVLLPNAGKIAYYELNFDYVDQDLKKMRMLGRMIDLIKKDPQAISEFVHGDPTYDSLYQTYGKYLRQLDAEARKRMSEKEYSSNQAYDIIRAGSYAEANRYGKYSGDNGHGALCYATNPNTWDAYTEDGRNTCYLCLRRDWKDVPCAKGDGYPKDDYGLSMIFLFVDDDGELAYSNVRWNHGDGSFPRVDYMFTEEEISDLVGRRFVDTFTPKK